MLENKALKPQLYSEGLGGQHAPIPVLHGGRCRCGYIFFPMQTYGCERCGRYGDALTPYALVARGTALAAATVHIHADKNRPAPFTIVKIALDDGPVIRTLLAEHSAAVSPGQHMIAKLVPVRHSETSETLLDLRFCAA